MSWATANCMRDGENGFLRYQLIILARHNSLAAVLDCSGKSQQYSVKSSSSSASQIFTVNNSNVTSFKVLSNQMDKPK